MKLPTLITALALPWLLAPAVVSGSSTYSNVTATVGTEYFDITSQFPVLLELGGTAGTQSWTFVPGIQFGGALTYGQSLQTYGVTNLSVGTDPYVTKYIFEGFQDVTSTYLYRSRQGVLLNDLQPGSTFNGMPVAQ